MEQIATLETPSGGESGASRGRGVFGRTDQGDREAEKAFGQFVWSGHREASLRADRTVRNRKVAIGLRAGRGGATRETWRRFFGSSTDVASRRNQMARADLSGKAKRIEVRRQGSRWQHRLPNCVFGGTMIAKSGLLAFNLICTGTQGSGEMSKPYKEVLRVDLREHTYCYGKCENTFPIASYDRSQIVFARGRDSFSGLNNTKTVDRVTGAYFWLETGTIGNVKVDTVIIGNCKRAPFTGLPRQKF